MAALKYVASFIEDYKEEAKTMNDLTSFRAWCHLCQSCFVTLDAQKFIITLRRTLTVVLIAQTHRRAKHFRLRHKEE